MADSTRLATIERRLTDLEEAQRRADDAATELAIQVKVCTNYQRDTQTEDELNFQLRRTRAELKATRDELLAVELVLVKLLPGFERECIRNEMKDINS